MEKVKGHRYLYRREGMLYFRRVVPLDVREAFGGFTEVWLSLEVGDVRDAIKPLAEEVTKFNKRLIAARRGVSNDAAPASPAPPAVPLRIEIEEAVREVLAERLAREHTDFSSPEEKADGDEHVAALAFQAETITQSLKLGSTVEPSLTTEWMAESLIERFRWDLPKSHPDYRFLLRLVAQSQREAILQYTAEMDGKSRQVHDARFAPEQYQMDAERKRARKVDEPVALLDLFDGYAAERKPAPATVKAYRRQIEAFIALGPIYLLDPI